MFTELRIAAGRRPLSRNELLVSAALGAVFTLFILAAIVDEYSPRKLSIVFFLVFWVPMLVLHELGHAVAARLCGWEVREIVIGFGRVIWQGRLGGTRIRVKLAPVEGYVLPVPTGRGAFRLKSAFVYAAGPGAELLLLGLLLAVFGVDGIFNDSDAVAPIALQSLAIVILLGAGFNLLPFHTEGAVSDGLGILSAPFLTRESIELRLMSGELREIGRLLDDGKADDALVVVRDLIDKYPGNPELRLIEAVTLAEADRIDEARSVVQSALEDDSLDELRKRSWLHQQAIIELRAPEPHDLVLDLALQKALTITPNAPDLLATKGVALVRRGRYVDGGNLLADAWRRNDGRANDAEMLGYLAVAADRIRHAAARDHFLHAYEQLVRSKSLDRRVRSLLDTSTRLAPRPD